MKKKIQYEDEPEDVDLSNARVIRDFLPPPEKLILKVETVKVTLSLSRHSIDFFKQEAERNGVKYQKMIRNLIDKYVSVNTR